MERKDEDHILCSRTRKEGGEEDLIPEIRDTQGREREREINSAISGVKTLRFMLHCIEAKSFGKEVTSKLNRPLESKNIFFVFTHYNRLFDFNRVHLQ